MSAKDTAPQTLIEAVRYFADEAVARNFVAAIRWPEGATCPECSTKDVLFMEKRRIWKCRDCKRQFSVKVGTVFEDSPIPLSKWLPAMWLIVNCKNGVSSYEVARALNVTQKTAWFMLHRLRLAMKAKSFEKMDGFVEVDETFLGGRAKNMHKSKRERFSAKRGPLVNKVGIQGVLKRGSPDGKEASSVRAMRIVGTDAPELQGNVRAHVEAGSYVYTDKARAYVGLSSDYTHDSVDHPVEYVRGSVHTNGVENFWSLFKRTIRGTYVSIDPWHLSRYLDEQINRFNNRKLNDAGRFLLAAAGIIGRRLTYAELTGKELQTA